MELFRRIFLNKLTLFILLNKVLKAIYFRNFKAFNILIYLTF